MKFIVSSTILLKNLQILNGVINASNTLPILDNFLFDISKDKLNITASDLAYAQFHIRFPIKIGMLSPVIEFLKSFNNLPILL